MLSVQKASFVNLDPRNTGLFAGGKQTHNLELQGHKMDVVHWRVTEGSRKLTQKELLTWLMRNCKALLRGSLKAVRIVYCHLIRIMGLKASAMLNSLLIR